MSLATPPAILEMQGLELSYATGRGVVRALRGVDLRVGDGEAVGLVGESGSGKSTVARAALGLTDPARARIDGGRILVNGRDVTRLSQPEWESLRGQPIAIVFQDPLSFLNPVLRVGRQIAESVRRHDGDVDIDARVAELLEVVKLPAACTRSYPHELSGGMRQRVLLAAALACRPSLLIADEPTTALDATTQAEILALLRELRARLGMAMLLISHDLGLVASACERIYVMYAGMTIERGPQAAIFGAPAHPYTLGLMRAATASRDGRGYFATIPGDPPDLIELPAGCAFAPRCEWADARCRAIMPGWASSSRNPDRSMRCWHPRGVPT